MSQTSGHPPATSVAPNTRTQEMHSRGARNAVLTSRPSLLTGSAFPKMPQKRKSWFQPRQQAGNFTLEREAVSSRRPFQSVLSLSHRQATPRTLRRGPAPTPRTSPRPDTDRKPLPHTGTPTSLLLQSKTPSKSFYAGSQRKQESEF